MKNNKNDKTKFLSEEYFLYHPFFKNGTFAKVIEYSKYYFDGCIYINYFNGKYYLRNIFPDKLEKIFIEFELATLAKIFGVDSKFISSMAPSTMKNITDLKNTLK